MRKQKENMTQFFRFCIVGLGNTTIDLIAFFLLIQFTVPVLLAQTIAYSAGVANSFWFNRKWTFQMKTKVNTMELVKFISVNLCALVGSVLILHVLYELNHIHLWISKGVSVGSGIIINFLGSRLWVFHKKQHPRSDTP